MRKLVAVAVVAVVSLLLAGAALAAFTQTSTITLTAHKAGNTTGIKASVSSTDPSVPQPKAAKSLVVTFPSQTKFNLRTPLVTTCTLSDADLANGSACPGKSLIGTGSAVSNAYPLDTAVPSTVKAYVSSSKSMVMVATANVLGTTSRTVLHATVSGSKLTIPIPTPVVSTIKVVLVALKLNVPAKGSGKTALVTAGKCSAHKFVVKSHFTYVDGSTFNTTSSSACS
jgi:predicted ribosomally synthesized peptide with SipW-like signal peptide